MGSHGILEEFVHPFIPQTSIYTGRDMFPRPAVPGYSGFTVRRAPICLADCLRSISKSLQHKLKRRVWYQVNGHEHAEPAICLDPSAWFLYGENSHQAARL